jgi:hypothetical protein
MAWLPAVVVPAGLDVKPGREDAEQASRILDGQAKLA